jgi:hypothetical protein
MWFWDFWGQFYCPSNSAWPAGNYDCLSGSLYLTPYPGANADLSFNGSSAGCNAHLYSYDTPAFIPVDSALDAYPVITSGTCGAGRGYVGIFPPFSTNPAQGWKDVATNDRNWFHCTVSDYLACREYNWVVTEFEGAASPNHLTCPAISTTRNAPWVQCSAIGGF